MVRWNTSAALLEEILRLVFRLRWLLQRLLLVNACHCRRFPEAARAMALQGADILLYPSAIGSEPHDSNLDSRHHWRRVMQGHSAANVVPVVACNRVGRESYQLAQYATATESSIVFCECCLAARAHRPSTPMDPAARYVLIVPRLLVLVARPRCRRGSVVAGNRWHVFHHRRHW